MELTWGSKERVGSRITPRLPATEEGVMVEASMVNEMGPVLLRVDLVPMRRSYVLSLLSCGSAMICLRWRNSGSNRGPRTEP